MLDHIEDLRTITDEDVKKLENIFNNSYKSTIGNVKAREVISLALLFDIAHNLREINRKLRILD